MPPFDLQAPLTPLTDREREILGLLAHGLSDSEIAETAILTIGTVKWYNRQIYSKLGVRNRTQAVAQAQALGLLTRPPGAASVPTPHNLPLQMTSFVGREAELGQLQTLLARARLVTLTGPPGTGKTRLALEAGAALLSRFPNGVFFVPLAAITDPRLVLNSIAQVLDVKEAGGASLLEALQHSLRDCSLLLILDNFEHLLSAAPLVSELLAALPGLTVLVTSREYLSLYGEYEVPLAPLQLPDLDLGRDPRPDALQRCEAIDLFVQRARAAAPTFALTVDNAATVAAICVHLDGLPLSIELAAARARFYAPQTLLVRLASRLEALRDGPRDLPARQRTLRATLAWSYDLLDEAEQHLFARLGIFAGGCTLAAAEAVCGDDLTGSVQAGLESLLAKSLLRHQQAAIAGTSRFVMLETMREYALEKLAASQELESRHVRHARHFMALAGQAAAAFNGPREAEWLAQLEAEHDNLRAALRWCLAHDAAQDGLRLIAHLARFWEVKGYLSESRDWLAEALRQPGAEARTPTRAAALQGVGDNAYIQCDYPAAQALFEEALAIYRDLDDRRSVATVLISIGEVATEVGDYDLAPVLFEQAYHIAAELARAGDDPAGLARALTQMGFGALRAGDLVQAQARLEEGLLAYRRADDQLGEALAASGLGEIAVRTGALADATRLLEDSLRLRRAIGHKWGVAASLGSLAWVALRQDDLDQAARILDESLRIRLDLGDRGGIAWCLEKLAEIAFRRGDVGQATRVFGAAAGLRANLNSVIDPADAETYAELIAQLRAALPDEVYGAVWAEGQAMTLAQVCAYVLPG